MHYTSDADTTYSSALMCPGVSVGALAQQLLPVNAKSGIILHKQDVPVSLNRSRMFLVTCIIETHEQR